MIVTDWITEEWIESLRIFNMPLLAVGSNPRTDMVPTVDYDWEEAARILTRRFVEAGYKRIGLINGESEYLPARAIFAGYKKALRESGVEFDPEIAVFTRFGRSHEDIIKYLRKNSDCDALIVENILDFFQGAWVSDVKKRPSLGWINSNREPLMHVPGSVVLFPDSLFERAAGALLDHLLYDNPLEAISLMPYLVTNNFNDAEMIAALVESRQ